MFCFVTATNLNNQMSDYNQ